MVTYEQLIGAFVESAELDDIQISSLNITSFTYADGSQSDGYILTSDTNGLATWQPLSGLTTPDLQGVYDESTPPKISMSIANLIIDNDITTPTTSLVFEAASTAPFMTATTSISGHPTLMSLVSTNPSPFDPLILVSQVGVSPTIGTAAVTGATPSGSLSFSTGTNIGGAGGSGILTLQTGTATVGPRGTIFILGGSLITSIDGPGGTTLSSTAGPTTISGSTVTLVSNDVDTTTSGELNIQSGEATGATGISGALTIASGDATDAASGNTGDVTIKTGDSTNADSGNIILETGTATGGTRGSIIFQDGYEGVAGYVWTSIGTLGEGSWAAAAGGGFTTLILSSGGGTAEAGQELLTDTSGGPFTHDLPASAVLGDRIRFVDGYGGWETNNLTVGRNGHNINGLASDLILDTDNATAELVYMNITQGWRIIV